ncbi:MAG: bifunctional 4-hydroxy-2-oxoglutarate aldolase/2-dehydro-3-deoxy-phosphogluconate aldolase [Aliiglaciecola sp.]
MKNMNHSSSRAKIMAQIESEKLVAIVRAKRENTVDNTVSCLVEGGVRVLEITSNTPGYCRQISLLRDSFPDVLVGAGTIIDGERARAAIDAGAQYLVTPNVSSKVVATAHKHNIPVLMGALTPTEIANALHCQADAIKLFPAGDMGIEYCKSLLGPYEDMPLFAVGGIHFENVLEWLEIGISGVGIGNALTAPVTNKAEAKRLADMARQLVQRIEHYKDNVKREKG